MSSAAVAGPPLEPASQPGSECASTALLAPVTTEQTVNLCHYCGVLPGSTRDHVVPRVLLERGKRMLGGYTNNSVPACTHCNGRKGSYRVDCCEDCLAKWQEHGPADWETTVTVVSKIWVAKKALALARQ